MQIINAIYKIEVESNIFLKKSVSVLIICDKQERGPSLSPQASTLMKKQKEEFDMILESRNNVSLERDLLDIDSICV